jgi:hypothetical protein
MTIIKKFVRFALLIVTTGGLFACGGQTVGDNNSSSSSSSSSSTSSTSSSSSSSGCIEPPPPVTSSSSSSSSSGWVKIAVNQYCATSIGVNHGTYFEIENSENGRLDLPEVGRSSKNDLHSGSVTLEYSNPNPDPVPLKLWLDSPLIPIDFELKPSGGEWFNITFNLHEAKQVSVTSAGDNGSVSIKAAHYWWRTGEFENLLEIGECPAPPLPGIGDTTPQAPKAQIQVRSDTCRPWVFGSVRADLSKNLEFNAGGSTDPNIEPLHYFWDFQDGTTAEGERVSHAFDTYGLHYVELTATDASGKSDKALMKVTVSDSGASNQIPVPVITANRTNLLRPFLSTTLWGDVSYDPDDDAIDHVWYNPYKKEVVRETEINVDLTGLVSPSSNVVLGVSDKRGGVREKTQVIYVADYPGQDCEVTYRDYTSGFAMEVKLYNNTSTPVQNRQVVWHTEAEISNVVTTGEAHSLDVYDSRSFAVRHYIPEYSWVSFRINGVSAVAIQDIGFKTQNGMTCIEHMPPRQSEPPVAKISASRIRGDVPFTAHFDADKSYDPDGEEIVSYLWDFGDGTKAMGRSVSHTYTRSGRFRVRLTVANGPLTASGDAGGAQKGSNVEYLIVDGDQWVACRAIISPTGQEDEYFIKAIYWDTSFTHGYPDPKFFGIDPMPVTINSGQISFSTPVVITQADSAIGIPIGTPIDDVSFAINKVVEPGGTASVQMTAVIEDLDKFYFTSCTFN